MVVIFGQAEKDGKAARAYCDEKNKSDKAHRWVVDYANGVYYAVSLKRGQ